MWTRGLCHIYGLFASKFDIYRFNIDSALNINFSRTLESLYCAGSHGNQFAGCGYVKVSHIMAQLALHDQQDSII